MKFSLRQYLQNMNFYKLKKKQYFLRLYQLHSYVMNDNINMVAARQDFSKCL